MSKAVAIDESGESPDGSTSESIEEADSLMDEIEALKSEELLGKEQSESNETAGSEVSMEDVSEESKESDEVEESKESKESDEINIERNYTMEMDSSAVPSKCNPSLPKPTAPFTRLSSFARTPRSN